MPLTHTLTLTTGQTVQTYQVQHSQHQGLSDSCQHLLSHMKNMSCNVIIACSFVLYGYFNFVSNFQYFKHLFLFSFLLRKLTHRSSFFYKSILSLGQRLFMFLSIYIHVGLFYFSISLSHFERVSYFQISLSLEICFSQ